MPIATGKKLTWARIPLLDSGDERADDHITIDGTLTLCIDGAVVIRDRWFRGNWFGLFGADAIDYEFPGGHAFRDRGSNRLIIRTTGPVRQTLIYEYRRYLLILRAAWYQVVYRVR